MASCLGLQPLPGARAFGCCMMRLFRSVLCKRNWVIPIIETFVEDRFWRRLAQASLPSGASVLGLTWDLPRKSCILHGVWSCNVWRKANGFWSRWVWGFGPCMEASSQHLFMAGSLALSIMKAYPGLRHSLNLELSRCRGAFLEFCTFQELSNWYWKIHAWATVPACTSGLRPPMEASSKNLLIARRMSFSLRKPWSGLWPSRGTSFEVLYVAGFINVALVKTFSALQHSLGLGIRSSHGSYFQDLFFARRMALFIMKASSGPRSWLRFEHWPWQAAFTPFLYRAGRTT